MNVAVAENEVLTVPGVKATGRAATSGLVADAISSNGRRAGQATASWPARYCEAVWADPVGWARTALGAHLWSRQRRALELLRDTESVVIPSCNSAGKTYLSAVAVLWYLNAVIPGLVVITSSSWKNVERQIWPLIHRFRLQMPFRELASAGSALKTEWTLAPGWAVYSISPDKPEVAGGYHAPNGVMFLIDEASAIEERMMEAIQGCMASGRRSRLLMIGNPLRCAGPFWKAWQQAQKGEAGIAGFSVSAFDVPNVSGAEPAIAGLATREWIERMRRQYGEESAAYQARVLGCFPKEDEAQLIPMWWVERAVQREPSTTDSVDRKRAGVDVARSAEGDRTVFQVIEGVRVWPPESWREPDLMVNARRVLAKLREHGIEATQTRVDDIGVGGGLTDRLWELGAPVVRVNVGLPASDPTRFRNQRAEAAWGLRMWIKDYAVLPSAADGNEDVERLHGDLAAVRLTAPAPNGAIRLEPKEETKARLGRSPDNFDALMLALYEPPNEQLPAATVTYL